VEQHFKSKDGNLLSTFPKDNTFCEVFKRKLFEINENEKNFFFDRIWK